MGDDLRSIGDIMRRGGRRGEAPGTSEVSGLGEAGAVEEQFGGTDVVGAEGSAEPPVPHDPAGLELAARIAAATASGGVSVRKRRRPGERSSAGRSGAGDLMPLSDAVDGLIARRGWRREVDLKKITADWATLVGQTNGEHSVPEAYVDRVLTIRATSTAWASNLRLLAPQLVAKLNAALGQGTIVRVEILGPSGPTWKHGLRVVRDGRGPRDTYG